MSTVSGLYPNAITPTVSPFGDVAQRAQQRRDNDAAVFAPVAESDATASGQNRSGRRGNQADAAPTSNNSAPQQQAATPPPGTQSNAQPNDDLPVSNEDSAFQRQRDEARAARQQAEQRQLDQDLETIRELAVRDREVRAHEQAHQAVGGQYAGGMSLTFERGPDGRRYAVAGEVPIDISPVPGDPAATMAKAEQVRRAALAPAEPSAQDRSVAAAAMQLKMEAQIELRQERRVEMESQPEEAGDDTATSEREDASVATERSNASEQNREESADNSSDRDDRRREALMRDLLNAQYQAQGLADPLGRQLDFMV